MTLSLTERAATHIKSQSDRITDILRVTAAPDGCAGLTYKVDLVSRIEANEYEYESHGITIITDSHSLPFIDGTEIDYVRIGLVSNFKFNNPNVTSCCGCGNSFNTGEED